MGLRIDSSAERMANSAAPAEHDRCPFSRLNLDVLRNICDMICEDQIDGDIVKSFDGLSRTNHLLRELSLPALFRTITIRGSWDNAIEKLAKMQNCPTLGKYTKLVSPLDCACIDGRLI